MAPVIHEVSYETCGHLSPTFGSELIPCKTDLYYWPEDKLHFVRTFLFASEVTLLSTFHSNCDQPPLDMFKANLRPFIRAYTSHHDHDPKRWIHKVFFLAPGKRFLDVVHE